MAENTDCYRKTDLHVHTPASVCYNDGDATAEDIVKAALAVKLDVLAVTDHNSVDGIEKIRKAAEDTELVILPGVELTTRHGHFLAFFDVNTPVEKMSDFLDSIGIDTDGRGNAQTVIDNEIENILRKIREYGGIAIAAHIDRWPSGLFESRDTRKRKQEIHENEYLDGLEITIRRERQDWENGQVRGFPMKRACVQGSDAHNPEEIGRRPVYIKMETANLTGLKKALDNYGTDIMFPEDVEANNGVTEG